MPLEPGSCIGPYFVEREIGRGGMGVVYLAKDPRINRAVAVKAIPIDKEFEDEELKEARLRFSAASARIGVAMASLYPSLSLTASGGSRSDNLADLVSGDGLVHNAVGNLLVSIPASPGHEKAPPLLIQGHVDMVCEKNAAT